MRSSFPPASSNGSSRWVNEHSTSFDPQQPVAEDLQAESERLRFRARIGSRAQTAVEDWRRRLHYEAIRDNAGPGAPVVRHLFAPSGMDMPHVAGDRSSLPFPRREVIFKASRFRSAARLLLWAVAAFFFLFGITIDWLHRRNTVENRARRLRETFERMGTTFIKIGQQLSMRLDLLPYTYTRELEKMLDTVPPFPVEVATATIERATGKSLAETFSAFDPEPIGSASVACVYHAVLHSGERVAVKVRRPRIGTRLAADMRALSWIAVATEQIFFAPGFTANAVFELTTMLMEELDFVREARFADLYRQRARKVDQLHFVSVPKVFFEYSSEEVMVSEFVSGIWMKDLLPAFESGDLKAAERMKELHIDPIILARRIQIIARFNNFESLFFHADLHPGNILVKPDNEIVLIDFGSCGSFSKKELNSWRRWFDAQSTDDVGGMVQAAMGIMEPLPPIDKDEFGMRMEYMFWTDLYAIKSKHSNWSERISSRLWMGFLNLSREFQIPLRLNLLRMIRASMLTDTIAIRLDNDQDPYKEFRRYEREAGWRAKSRLHKRTRQLLGPGKYIRLEQGLDSSLKLIYQVQRVVDSLASIRIGAIIGRLEYFITLILRAFTWTFVSAAGMTCAAWLGNRLNWYWLYFGVKYPAGQSLGLFGIFRAVTTSSIWLVIAVAPLIFVLWRVSFRLQERRPWDS